MSEDIIFDVQAGKYKEDLIKNQNINLYNYGNYIYNEYPHKSIWLKKFSIDDLKNSFLNSSSPFLLYVHIPFCETRCLYCLCHTKITKNYEFIKKYLNGLFHEIDLYKQFFNKNNISPLFKRIHIGGGSPSILKENDFDILIKKIRDIVDMKLVEEFAIEIDPRHITINKLKHFHSMGVNRLSFGIQDFDFFVQKNINRIQPVSLIQNLLTKDIRNLFSSINFDVICGLPGQTRDSFRETIDTIIRLSPDRIMLMFLSLSPDVKKHQKLMLKYNLPGISERMVFWNDACKTLLDNGYVRIGIDHFAKPDDVLAKAMKNKNIHWNSLGYGVGKNFSVLGLGTSTSSDIKQGNYFQNTYSINEYLYSISNNVFPVFRSFKLSKDDIIRRDVIHTLRCNFYLNFYDIEDKYGIDFKNYFNMELDLLDDFSHNNMINIDYNSITVNDSGKHFFGFIFKVFDKYRNMELV